MAADADSRGNGPALDGLPTRNEAGGPDRGAWWRLQAFRIVCGVAIVVGTYVAAALGQAHHAGWVAAGIGLPLAAGTTFALREVPVSFLACRFCPGPPVSDRPALVLPIAAALLVLALLPVLLVKLPAFDDYANHLARAYVIFEHGRDPLLDRFYAIRWRVIPNLGMDIVTPWIAAATGIFAAGKLTIVLYTVLLFTGPFAIHAALYKELSFGQLVGILFIYNSIAKYGNVNYLLGIGLALYAVAGWIVLRRRHPLLRAAVSLVCVLVLFFCHLMSLATYGLAIGSYELWLICTDKSRGKPLIDRSRLIALAVLVLPFAIAFPLLALGPHDDPAPIASRWGGMHVRLDGLRYVLQAYRPDLDLAAAAIMATTFILALRHRMLQFHPVGWLFLAVSLVFFVAIPNRAMGSWGAAVRVPIAVVYFLIGLLRWNLPSVRARRAFVAVVTAITLLRTASVAGAFVRYDAITADFEQSLKLVVPGSRILVADDYDNEQPTLTALRELACIAIIERSSLISIAYAHPLQQILDVRPPYRDSAGGYSDLPISIAALRDPTRHYSADEMPFFDPSGRIYWSDWQHTYDYIYIMNRHGQPNPLPHRLALLYDGDRFQLFRVVHPDAAQP
jgi:hypothetical protein